VRFESPCSSVELVEVFFDDHIVEVFVNGGESVGTVLFDTGGEARGVAFAPTADCALLRASLHGFEKQRAG
jgi:sucrose-6-phosphate hydrolase SacC (GH32 family)